MNAEQTSPQDINKKETGSELGQTPTPELVQERDETRERLFDLMKLEVNRYNGMKNVLDDILQDKIEENRKRLEDIEEEILGRYADTFEKLSGKTLPEQNGIQITKATSEEGPSTEQQMLIDEEEKIMQKLKELDEDPFNQSSLRSRLIRRLTKIRLIVMETMPEKALRNFLTKTQEEIAETEPIHSKLTARKAVYPAEVLRERLEMYRTIEAKLMEKLQEAA